MTDPIRLLEQGLDLDVLRAIQAARSAEPPATAYDQVWNALSVALPAGVLLGATTTAHAEAAIMTTEAAGVTTAGASVTTAGASVGAATTMAATAVAVKTGLAVIATKAVALGLGVGLTVHAVSGIAVREGSQAPTPSTSIAMARTAQARTLAPLQRHSPVMDDRRVDDQRGVELSLAPDAQSPLTRDLEPRSQKPFEEPTIDELREESALLVLVRQAVKSSQPTQALQLIAQHQQRFAGGRLIQERDALEVQALSKLGHAARARARAKDFLARYPDSPYRETIAALVWAEPSSE